MFRPTRRAILGPYIFSTLVLSAPGFVATCHGAPVVAAEADAGSDLQRQWDDCQQQIRTIEQLLNDLRKTEHNETSTAMEETLQKRLAEQTIERDVLLQKIREQEALAGQQQIDELQAAIKQRDAQVEQLNEQLAAMERTQEAVPMDDDAVIRVFRLKFLAAADAAQTVSSILGNRMRVAVDARANSLVVAGSENALAAVSTLVETLDVESGDNDFDPAAAGEEADDKAAEDYAYAKATRSLLVRVYWLADGVADDEGTPPIGPLPQSVVDAVGKLGLDKPRLIGQTVNSLSRDGNPYNEVTFQSRVPALLFKRPVQLKCAGKISPIRDGRVDLSMQLQAEGSQLDTELSGSLTVPLGHYMVLGTANSVVDVSSDEERQARLKILRAQQRAAELEGRGRGGGGGVAPPADVPDPKYATSHFAFVVQVVEGESFSGE